MSGRRRNAWLTPDTGTGQTLSRCLTFPRELLPHVTGALSALTEPWRWEQYGTMTPSDAAYYATLMLDQFINDCEGSNVLLRQNETEPCILERSDDNGATWLPFADLSLCAAQVVEPEPSDYTDVRENPTTGELEFSLDGGTTWTDIPIPDGTPPTNPWAPARSPSPGATQDEQRCSAATRAANNLNAMYQQTYGAIGAGVLNTLSGINSFLRDLNNFLADIVWGEYWDIAQAVGFENNYSPTQYASADLGTTALDALTCLLYDNATVGNLGVVSFDFGAVRDNVISELGVNPGTAVWTHLNYVGEAGLNRLGEFGFGTTDCVCGDWCFDFDFTVDDGGFSRASDASVDPEFGNWVSGSGWNSDDSYNNPINAQVRGIYIERTWSARRVNQWYMDFDWIGGSSWPNLALAAVSVQLRVGTSWSYSYVRSYSSMTHALGQQFSATVNLENVTGIRLFLRTAIDQTAPYTMGGECRVTGLLLNGEDGNPFGEDNC